MTRRLKHDPAVNRRWLREEMPPYFYLSMQDEPEALAILERELDSLRYNRQLVLADREKSLILAVPNLPGSLYATLHRFPEREVSYAMFAHSAAKLPGREEEVEVQRFEFDRRSNEEVLAGPRTPVPLGIRRRVAAALRLNYPEFDHKELDRLLGIIWCNNERYVKIASPLRLAQVLQLFQKGNRHGGLYLDVEPREAGGESRVHFAVANPPQRDFLLQVTEVFKRLSLGIDRAYCLTISNGIHPYFLATFYVRRLDGRPLCREDELFLRLQRELSVAQILTTRSPLYREFLTQGLLTGEEATLANAFIAFCHTSLAHADPDRFGLEDVRGAFYSHPEIVQQLIRLFVLRFDPVVSDRSGYNELMAAAQKAIELYNTGHRYLDDVRRTIFGCVLLLIRHTLKTNFFVLGKQALAFRLDPTYLGELGGEAVADLPPATPFRITFFFSRYGFGYHIGFSDIARGGWRTVIARNSDDFITSANTLFRENYVLAHTQHLKNKDIYEGGAKLVTLLDVSDLRGKDPEGARWRLYKLQYGIANAFLDLFVTEQGVAKHPAIIDYYREDEPIELGPDENMHDDMIEAIASLSQRRGYILGIGIMSSKQIGINHKEYGVTSTGVVTFAEHVLAELGIDMRTAPFAVKFTGGPNGDVAGNAMRILLERAPQVAITLILDGTAALYDPQGADHEELRRLLLRHDLDAFSPERLHPGGFLLLRSGSRREGLRELFRKVTRGENGLVEEWISIDEFSRLFDDLVFTVAADIFLPAGGRPETIDGDNWQRFLRDDGTPSAQAIVEGANSFLTPEARLQLQRKGVIIMRDASANKCGVISSSYEIIANLLLSPAEFLAHKERYVADVLTILERRAADEARLILQRRREQPGTLCTDISDALSSEINANYTRLFRYFQERPQLLRQTLFRQGILAHLPEIIRTEPRFRARLSRLPEKYRFAILAAEIGSSMVYRSVPFEEVIRLQLARTIRGGSEERGIRA